MSRLQKSEDNVGVEKPMLTPFAIFGAIALAFFLLNVAVADNFDLASAGGRANIWRQYFDWRFWPQWYGKALWLAVATQTTFLLVRSRAFRNYVGKVQKKCSSARLAYRQAILKNVERLTLWVSAIAGVGIVVLNSELFAASRRSVAESAFAVKVFFYQEIYIGVCLDPLSQYLCDGTFSWKIFIHPTICVALLFVCFWILRRENARRRFYDEGNN